jgi:hypothetical protein
MIAPMPLGSKELRIVLAQPRLHFLNRHATVRQTTSNALYQLAFGRKRLAVAYMEVALMVLNGTE